MGADNSKYADGEGGQVAYIAQRTQVRAIVRQGNRS